MNDAACFAAARVAVRLGEFGLSASENRGLYRYWRLTHVAEDALLGVVVEPKPAPAHA